MCLIVDANVASQFLGGPSAIRGWLLGLHGNPRLVASGKLRTELARIASVRKLLVQLERAGRLRSVPPERLEREHDRLRTEGRCESNDLHVLALAVTSGARTLATLDVKLSTDFTNPNIINQPRGRIYRVPNHAHLLRHTPKSCGVRASDRKRRRR